MENVATFFCADPEDIQKLFKMRIISSIKQKRLSFESAVAQSRDQIRFLQTHMSSASAAWKNRLVASSFPPWLHSNQPSRSTNQKHEISRCPRIHIHLQKPAHNQKYTRKRNYTQTHILLMNVESMQHAKGGAILFTFRLTMFGNNYY